MVDTAPLLEVQTRTLHLGFATFLLRVHRESENPIFASNPDLCDPRSSNLRKLDRAKFSQSVQSHRGSSGDKIDQRNERLTVEMCHGAHDGLEGESLGFRLEGSVCTAHHSQCEQAFWSGPPPTGARARSETSETRGDRRLLTRSLGCRTRRAPLRTFTQFR